MIVVLALLGVAWPSGVAIAQTRAEGIVREWVLRGVVISEAGRSAVFEHVSSGRQERFEIGATVTPSVTVATIGPDHVVLNTEGGERVTLRLGHGGQGQAVRRPVPTARRVPPRAISR